MTRVQIRSVALPVEHGGWSLLLEPVAVGLALAPGWSGAALAWMFVFGYLMNHPLRIAAQDMTAKRFLPRTRLAVKFSFGYGSAAVALLMVLGLTEHLLFLWPVVLAFFLFAYQFYFSIVKAKRHLVPELAGSAALAASAAAIPVLGGWPLRAAGIVWLIMAARAVTSVMYVRHRLQKEKGQSYSPGLVLTVHGVCALMLMALMLMGVMPSGVVAGFAFLCLRAAYGLYLEKQTVRPQIIGIREIFIGLIFAVLVVLSYRL